MTVVVTALMPLVLSYLAPAAVAQQGQGALPPCIAAENSPLGSLVGSWTVEWHYRTAPGEFAVSPAKAEISLDLEGCAITEHFRGTLRGAPYVALTVISRPSEAEYDRVRIDSEHGSFAQSSGSAVGDSLIFNWERQLATRMLRTRHQFTDIQPSSFTVEFFMSPRMDTPWELVHKAHYRRVNEQ